MDGKGNVLLAGATTCCVTCWHAMLSAGPDAPDADQDTQKKDKIQFLSRRNARSSNSTMQNVLRRKIYVSSSRAAELEQFQEDAERAGKREADGLSPDPAARQQDTGASASEASVLSESTDKRIPVLLLGFTDEQVTCSSHSLHRQCCCNVMLFLAQLNSLHLV